MKVAIYWYGAEGQSSYRYYSQKGDDVTIVTPKVSPSFPLPEGAKSIVGEIAADQLNGFDIVVRSAGTRPDSLKTDGKIWSSTNEFFAQCPVPIIGVTGTKGKGTTSSLIASILRAAGKTVHLVGNIGTPPLDVLPNISPDDIVVFELSSFQLWDLEKSPHVAVVLMIEPDHLDVHSSMEEYVDAKGAIRRYQTLDDICFYHPTNTYAHHIAMTGDWPEDDEERVQWQEQAFRYATKQAVYIEDGKFMVHGVPICSTDAVQLPGDFNLENACAAISAARVFTVDSSAIEQGLRDFNGLPHRLNYVDEIDGVAYYDDSIATTPGSARAAMHAFDTPKVLIFGGSDKGADYEQLVKEAGATNTQVVAIGQTGEKIAQYCSDHAVPCQRVTGGMIEVVQAAQSMAKPGGVVILSPASASFDQYNSYSDRGDQFVAAVKGLKG